MVKVSFLFVLLIFPFYYTFSQSCAWTKGYTVGRGDMADCICSALGAKGNLYVAGNFNSKTLKIENATLTNTRFIPGLLNEDIFLSNFDASGNLIWAKKFGGIKRDNVLGLVADSEGNVLLYGDSGGADVTNGTTKTKVKNLFIVKYDYLGNITWVKDMNGFGFLSVKLDSQNNIYCTGSFRYPIQLDNFLLNHSDSSSNDIFVMKLDKSGVTKWVHSAGGEGNDAGTAMSIDSKGNVIVFAEYRSKEINIGGNVLSGTGISITPENLIIKYSDSGKILWSKKRERGVSPSTLCTCDNLDNIYLTVNSTEAGCYITKYDPNGVLLTHKKYPTSIKAIFMDQTNKLHCAGTFTDSIIPFGTGSLTKVNPSDGKERINYDGYFFNFTDDGKPYSSYSLGGSDGGYDETVSSVLVDKTGAVYVSGNFSGNTFRSGKCELKFPEDQSGFFITKILPKE